MGLIHLFGKHPEYIHLRSDLRKAEFIINKSMILQVKHGILSLLLLLGLINSSYATTPAPIDPKILHIVNRLSFGLHPGDIQKIQSIGVEGYIQEQLTPNSIIEPASLTMQLSQLKTTQMNPVQLMEYEMVIAPGKKLTLLEQKIKRERAKHVLNEAIKAKLLRAVDSPKQLQEVMVDFWYNHFNVDANKGRSPFLVGVYEQVAIRPYVLGRFRDLLAATAHDPAMLYYLDNWQNRVTSRPNAQGKVLGLNENYARELMELHTLGVDGGYTQQDVIALARILSGWGIRLNPRLNNNVNNNYNSGFEFNSKHHDFSDKVFLGHHIKGRGEAEGEEALDILSRSPATAHHLSYKIAQYFVSDKPSETLVKKLSQRYLATDGNIREVLNTLFHSSEFWDQKNFYSKFKTPYQYAISVVRATGIDVHNTQPIINLLEQLAMPVYGCQTPDGYKNTADLWLNPDAITRRLSFATAIASGNIPLSRLPMPKNQMSVNIRPQQNSPRIAVDTEQLINTLGNAFSAKTQNAIATNSPQIRSALILGSPEFMRR
jgi:uncharacterized protein (DUF1800 family)